MGHLYRLDFVNRKSYVGIAFKSAFRRFRDHKSTAMKSNSILYKAWRKYGEPTMNILAVIEDTQLHETERKAIFVYKTKVPYGYNLTDGGEGVLNPAPEIRAKMRFAALNRSDEAKARHRAAVTSPEYCEKIRKANRERQYTPHTMETRAKMRVAQGNLSPEIKANRTAKIIASRIGVSPSLEVRAKISAANKGKTLSLEHRAKLSLAAMNRSPEHRANLSMAARGRVYSPEARTRLNRAHRGRLLSTEHRAKITTSLQGHTVSPETRAKIGNAHRGKTISPEARAKMSAARKKYCSDQRALASMKAPA